MLAPSLFLKIIPPLAFFGLLAKSCLLSASSLFFFLPRSLLLAGARIFLFPLSPLSLFSLLLFLSLPF